MKFNLVFDGQNFLHRSLHSFNGGTADVKLSNENEQGLFIRKIAIDFAYLIKIFENYLDRVIFTEESKSWRKLLIEAAEYKATRVPNEKIDWEAFDNISFQFKNQLAKTGVDLYQITQAEGDDIIELLRLQNNFNIIVSSDQDMLQTVNFDTELELNFNLVLNPIKKEIYVTQEFQNWLLDEYVNDDIFLTKNLHLFFKNDFQNSLKKAKISLVVINPIKHLFYKIFLGDKGDNISQLKKGLGEKAADKVWEEWISTYPNFQKVDLLNPLVQNDLLVTIMNICKLDKSLFKELHDRLLLNIKLIYLHVNIIPSDITEECIKIYNKNITKKQKHSQLKSHHLILADTDWLSKEKEYVPKTLDPFKGLNLW